MPHLGKKFENGGIYLENTPFSKKKFEIWCLGRQCFILVEKSKNGRAFLNFSILFLAPETPSGVPPDHFQNVDEEEEKIAFTIKLT